ncbi:MAG: hypothetical protein AABX83_02060 [Nanoarchaeota archaeon]
MASTKKFIGYLLAAFALMVLSVVNVSAIPFGTIQGVEVSGVDAVTNGVTSSVDITAFASQTIPVKVIFLATEDAEDVRVKVWISGEREFATVSERFDVIKGKTYSRTISVQIPSNLKDELDESLNLNVVVENRNDGTADEELVSLTLQRASYVLEILDANMADSVNAGELLPIDVVIKNIGRQFADDTFVRVSIPALKIEDRAYFSDLAPVDNPILESGDLREVLENENDAAERRLFLRIPSNVPAGVYVVEIEAFNQDSITSVSRKLVISGAEESSMVVAPVHSKSLKAGQTSQYDLVLVNSGTQLRVFELVIESPNGLNVAVSEPVIALAAGTSRTVKLDVSADKAADYEFAVNIHSGTQLVKRESFTANVQGASATAAASPTVLLTVVLAVIFIVLLIVLIVLLTRKPEKSEETGESYY